MSKTIKSNNHSGIDASKEAGVEDQRNQQRDSFAGMSLGGVQRYEVAGGVYYTSERGGAFYAIGFAGKSVKPAFNYRFSSEERRQLYIEEWTARLARDEQERERRKNERKNDTHSLVVGSVLCNSWGYEQTNVDWYEVTKVISPKMVEVRKIAAVITVQTDAMAGKTMPQPGEYKGEPMRKRANSHGVTLSSRATAQLWNGQPQYVSWYA